VILSDINMPVTDGLELLHEIKTHSAGTEGIALLRGLICSSGTESSQTLRWREPDSNLRYRGTKPEISHASLNRGRFQHRREWCWHRGDLTPISLRLLFEKR